MRTLGEFGARVDRFDLMQVGYERALEEFEAGQAQIMVLETARVWAELLKKHGDRTLFRAVRERVASLDSVSRTDRILSGEAPL